MGYRKAVETRIASAVLTLLQAATFELSGVTVSRGSLPVFEKEVLTSPKVVIVPTAKEGEGMDRARESQSISIGVAVTKSVGLGSATREAEVEDLLALCEQIQDYLSDRDRQVVTLPAVLGASSETLQESHNARLVPPMVQSPSFDASMLREKGIFFSVLIFNYHFEIERD